MTFRPGLDQPVAPEPAPLISPSQAGPLARPFRPLCQSCAGEGVVGGLVVGDDVVDERCGACHGTGTVLTLWWCKTSDGRIVEHETTDYERHSGHVRCVPVGPL